MEQYDFPRDIQDVTNSLDDEKIAALLDFASQNYATYDRVAKSTVHFTCLGNEAQFRLARKLVLALEEMEESRPDLKPKENIVNKMVATFRGASDKPYLTTAMIRQHEWRVHASFTILQDISKKRPLKVAMPLLAGGRDPLTRKHAHKLVHQILMARLGTTDIDTLKSIVAITTAIINKTQRSEDGSSDRDLWGQHVLMVVDRIIEECENPLVYFAGPVLASMRSNENESRFLLDKILEKSFGNMDEEMLIELAKIVNVAIDLERVSSQTDYEYAIKIARKAFRECANAPAYFLRNLLLSYEEPQKSAGAETLLSELKSFIESGGRLGNPDEVTLQELQKCLRLKRSRGNTPEHVEFFIAQMQNEGLWPQNPTTSTESSAYVGPKWHEGNRREQEIRKRYGPHKPEFLRSKLHYKR